MCKRSFDITLSVIGLILLAPIFFVVSLAIFLERSDGPIFFKQTRLGLRGRPFRIIKFRTMAPGIDAAGQQVTQAGDKRVTGVGRFLRQWKLDELPQLANVLRGEMSLVGPRPEVPYFMDQYPKEQRDIILSVRPGITDLAAIALRNEEKILAEFDDVEHAYVNIIMPKKFEFYNEYVRKSSLSFDIYVIFRTFMAILRR